MVCSSDIGARKAPCLAPVSTVAGRALRLQGRQAWQQLAPVACGYHGDMVTWYRMVRHAWHKSTAASWMMHENAMPSPTSTLLSSVLRCSSSSSHRHTHSWSSTETSRIPSPTGRVRSHAPRAWPRITGTNWLVPCHRFIPCITLRSQLFCSLQCVA